jgi:hypothetical protein
VGGGAAGAARQAAAPRARVGARRARDCRHEQAVLEGMIPDERLRTILQRSFAWFRIAYVTFLTLIYLLFLWIFALIFCIVWRSGHGLIALHMELVLSFIAV